MATGFVYFIGELEGCHKIGMSKDPAVRVLQFTVLPSELRVVHQIATTEMSWLEGYLHAAYAEKRVRGEWFRLTPEDVALLSSVASADREEDLPAVLAGKKPKPPVQPIQGRRGRPPLPPYVRPAVLCPFGDTNPVGYVEHWVKYSGKLPPKRVVDRLVLPEGYELPDLPYGEA